MSANTRQNEQLMGRRLCFYSIYAWGVPLLIVIIGQILDNIGDLNIVTPDFGKRHCWFGKCRLLFTIAKATEWMLNVIHIFSKH